VGYGVERVEHMFILIGKEVTARRILGMAEKGYTKD
jgi:hypothetical protein